MHSSLALLALALVLAASAAATLPRNLGSFSVNEPAFVTFMDGSLYISSFSGSPFTDGSIYVVQDVAGQLASGTNYSDLQVSTAVSSDDGVFKWPNEMTPVPLVGTELGAGLLVQDGFLPPGKTEGGVYFVNTSDAPNSYPTQKLTSSKTDGGWWYHRSTFVDMNNDGLLDVLTARAAKPLLGSGSGQLIWLEHPPSGQMSFPWVEHVIADGPDIGYYALPLDTQNTPWFSAPVLVYAAEFFAERVTGFIVGFNGTVQDSVVIDKSIGAVYDVKPLTPPLLNGLPRNDTNEGNNDHLLLVTNYQYHDAGSLYSYTVPAASNPLQIGNRSTIYDQFQNVQYQPGSGAPGWIFPHFSNVQDWNDADAVPNVFVCGDGSEELYLFTPDDISGEYRLAMHKSYGATVGSMAFNANSDGSICAWVTIYDSGIVDVFCY